MVTIKIIKKLISIIGYLALAIFCYAFYFSEPLWDLIVAWLSNNIFVVLIGVWITIFFLFRYATNSLEPTLENDKWALQQSTLLIIAILLFMIYEKLP